MQRGAEGSGGATVLLAEALTRFRQRSGQHHSRRTVLAMLVVALASMLGAGVWVASSQPRRIAVGTPLANASEISPNPSRGTSKSAAQVVPGGSLMSPLPLPSSGSAAAGAAVAVVVDVVGRVRRPGVYRLAVGARVVDALAAAGGAVAGVDLTGVNLARKLLDGEQIAIGVPAIPVAPETAGQAVAGDGSPRSSTPGTSPSGVAAAGPIDLNSASVSELDSLPGVGPVLAQRIVDWRTQHGRFDSVDQLRSVTGIGDSKYADLKPLVTV
ncbi:ComEA family DNA-binding protein [Jatrophihabitans sp. DSM 45814]